MTPEAWNPDDALVEPEQDDGEQAAAWRYGVTPWEAAHPEPLDLALAEEEPEPDGAADDDEQWALVDDADAFPGRLVADEEVRDDDYALSVDDPNDLAPEELAMHVVEP